MNITRRAFCGLAVFAAICPADALSQAAEGQPGEKEFIPPFHACPHVDDETAAMLKRDFGTNLACCNHCLQLVVGNVSVSLYDNSFIDMVPGDPGKMVASAGIFGVDGAKTLDEFRAQKLEALGFTRTPHELIPTRQHFKLQGMNLSYITHVVENDRGERFLSYRAYTPKDYRWYNEVIKPGLVGWVLGLHQLDLFPGDEGFNEVLLSEVSLNQLLAQGRLSFRANAFIAIK